MKTKNSSLAPTKQFKTDHLIFTPRDVDLSYSPLRSLDAETYVLGAFNPGFNRLPNGNLIMMVRVAEALVEPIKAGVARQIRWQDGSYVLDEFDLATLDTRDPRHFLFKTYQHATTFALTSLSWLLPVELSPAGDQIVEIHYDKIIAPSASYQAYGVEDARISLVEGMYYMTTCSVSAERHCTTLYTSTDGLHYQLHGIILDHQNKDMVFFEGKIKGKFYALTRPLGLVYFSYSADSDYLPGPSINLAVSPDALHWKPTDHPFLRAKKGTSSNEKVGGGAQPILTPAGWLVIYHGVEKTDGVGVYRSFWALLDKEDPHNILRLEDTHPLLEARPDLTAMLADQIYLDNIVFTTGIVPHGDDYIVASGELDLCCRITHIPKDYFQ